MWWRFTDIERQWFKQSATQPKHRKLPHININQYPENQFYPVAPPTTSNRRLSYRRETHVMLCISRNTGNVVQILKNLWFWVIFWAFSLQQLSSSILSIKLFISAVFVELRLLTDRQMDTRQQHIPC